MASAGPSSVGRCSTRSRRPSVDARSTWSSARSSIAWRVRSSTWSALGGEFKALGVDLVVLDQAIDTTTSAGRAMFGMLAVFAEFERDLIRERVVGGLQRAKALGKRVGRPPSTISREQVVALRETGPAIASSPAASASPLHWPT